MTTQQMAIGSTGFAAASAASVWLGNLEAPEPLRMAGTVVHVPEDHEIFTQGDSPDVFFKVVSGTVRICKFLSDGRRQIEAFHVAGDVFGFELGGEYALSAEAVSECTLISYRRRGVEMLAQKDETVTRQLFQYAMRNLARAQGHSLLLGRRGAGEKVAAFLLDMAKQSANKRAIHLAMTRQDIADYLGLTIETVSRTLTQFERDGMIAMPNTREIMLRNVEALQDLAD